MMMNTYERGTSSWKMVERERSYEIDRGGGLMMDDKVVDDDID